MEHFRRHLRALHHHGGTCASAESGQGSAWAGIRRPMTNGISGPSDSEPCAAEPNEELGSAELRLRLEEDQVLHRQELVLKLRADEPGASARQLDASDADLTSGTSLPVEVLTDGWNSQSSRCWDRGLRIAVAALRVNDRRTHTGPVGVTALTDGRRRPPGGCGGASAVAGRSSPLFLGAEPCGFDSPLLANATRTGKPTHEGATRCTPTNCSTRSPPT